MKLTDRISLKKVHYAHFASQETSCFSATLCFDGVPVCEVSNEGTGGADHHHPLKGENYAQMKTRLAPVEAYVATFTYVFDGETDHHNLETAVGEVLEAYLVEREFNRRMKSHMLYTRSDEPGAIFMAKVEPKNHAIALESWRNKRPGITYVALAALPREEALAIYRAAGSAQ